MYNNLTEELLVAELCDGDRASKGENIDLRFWIPVSLLIKVYNAT